MLEYSSELGTNSTLKCSKCKRGLFLHKNKCLDKCPHNYRADKMTWTCIDDKIFAWYWNYPSKSSCKKICIPNKNNNANNDKNKTSENTDNTNHDKDSNATIDLTKNTYPRHKTLTSHRNPTDDPNHTTTTDELLSQSSNPVPIGKL